MATVDQASRPVLFLGLSAIVWQCLFLWVPVLLLLGASLVSWSDGTFSINPFQFGEFFRVEFGYILLRSVSLAVATSFLCALIAYPLVYWVVLRVKRWSTLILFLIVLPFWTNLLVLVYGWFFVLERTGLINTMLQNMGFIEEPLQLLYSPGATYLLMLYCYLPYMILPLYSALEKIDPRLIEASRDLGASSWQTFTNVIFPLSLRGMRNGLYLVLIPAFGEFVIPALVGGGRYYYAGSLISHLFLISRNMYAGARFTVVAGIVLAGTCALIELLYRYCARKMGHING